MELGPPPNEVRAALKWSQGRPEMELGPPQNGVRAAPKWSKGRPEIESGGLIISSRFSSFLLILSSVRGKSCTI